MTRDSGSVSIPHTCLKKEFICKYGKGGLAASGNNHFAVLHFIQLLSSMHDLLRVERGHARALDKGRGRLRETVEAVTVEGGDEALEGVGALHLAAARGNLEMCAYLVEELRVDVNAVDNGGRTPLIHAMYGERVGTFKYLLDHGANPDRVDPNGFAPLHSAAGSGYCEMVKLLLARGACTDPVTCCGTPLHIAATEGQDCAMKILLGHNADYNKMINGMTPLYFAINVSSVKCAKLLIQAGAVANGDFILTALADAPRNGSAECLNCLLGFGGEWRARNDKLVSLVSYLDMEYLGAVKEEPVDRKKVAELKSQGSKAVARKDFLSAAEAYSMALELDPDDATLFSNRSLCWLHIGKGGKPLLSLLDAYECKKRRPDWSKAFYRESKALALLKDYKGACDALLNVLKMDPGNAEIEDGLRMSCGLSLHRPPCSSSRTPCCFVAVNAGEDAPLLTAMTDAADSCCSTDECCIAITGDFNACCTEAPVFCGSIHGGESGRLETKKEERVLGEMRNGWLTHAGLQGDKDFRDFEKYSQHSALIAFATSIALTVHEMCRKAMESLKVSQSTKAK
ncbi:unnamed protein product [Triticum turgidum subsp. durum]|uniref:Uncharacterized protein n=1 Tax=Triticum turgidum subsp. durum TaxID=4567 RepID=A0A9R0RY92_TRITD|nr:unnamed protein product [Triticum turgidum subsp. durum]